MRRPGAGTLSQNWRPIAAMQERQDSHKELLAQLDGGQTQVSVTDPENHITQ